MLHIYMITALMRSKDYMGVLAALTAREAERK